MVSNDTDMENFTPNPQAYYFREGKNLVWYEPRGYSLEMFGVVMHRPKKPVSKVYKQWEYLKGLGFYSVYATVDKNNLKSAIMCRAFGMSKIECEGSKNIYKRVIYG